MKVVCRTNLDDVMQCEKFPTELPAVPNVGDYIVSNQVWRGGYQLRLRVSSVTWVPQQKYKPELSYGKDDVDWVPEIELHLPTNYLNISHFENHYNYRRGRIDQETYSRRDQQIRSEAYAAGHSQFKT